MIIKDKQQIAGSFNALHGNSVQIIILNTGDISLRNGNINPLIIFCGALFGIVNNHGHGASWVNLDTLGRWEEVHIDLIGSLNHDLGDSKQKLEMRNTYCSLIVKVIFLQLIISAAVTTESKTTFTFVHASSIIDLHFPTTTTWVSLQPIKTKP